ncbi:SH3 domain-containing protein [Rhizobium sp. PAMB 3182]
MFAGIRTLAVASALCLGFSAAAASAATQSHTLATVNLRAGPSTAYPVIKVMPVGAPIVTFGCLANYSWCDVGYAGNRGWVSAKYIQVDYNGAPVVVTPSVAIGVGIGVVTFGQAYWDTHYGNYPWYRNGGAYPPPPTPPAAAASGSRTTSCAGGTCTTNGSMTGPYGGSTSLHRTCSGPDGTCAMTRTGPNGGGVSRSWQFNR